MSSTNPIFSYRTGKVALEIKKHRVWKMPSHVRLKPEIGLSKRKTNIYEPDRI
jgi:hypothetical protein